MQVHWHVLPLRHATIGAADCVLCGGLVAPKDADGDGLCDDCEKVIVGLMARGCISPATGMPIPQGA